MSNWLQFKTLFLLIAFGFSVGNASQNTDDWYKCKTAVDCEIVKANCGVEWTANKKFVEQSRKNPPRTDGPCKKPLEDHPANTFSICVNNKCQLYPPGTYSGGRSISKDKCVVSSCWGHLGCNYLTCTSADGSNFTEYAQ